MDLHNSTANSYFDSCFTREGLIPGFYVMVSDNDKFKMEILLNDYDINYKKIGQSTYRINDDVTKEEKLINKLCELVINNEFDNFMLKKF